ncbi:MAG: PDDEXK nuclease domain-containing protein, partial [bacterium]
RDFYEREAVAGCWDKRTLERQVHTQYYDRCLHSQHPDRMITDGRRLQHTQATASELLKKTPYVLEFLGYPDFAELREADVEQAIITHLQRFLLELGNGFAFVARQKHIRIEEDDRFIDLVFYHCRMKFYLLIDLKMGKLAHGDVGQMDGYVRMYDGLFNSALMNDAVYKFKRYEDSSLSYTGIFKHEGEDIGLYDTVITRKDAQKVFENVPAAQG